MFAESCCANMICGIKPSFLCHGLSYSTRVWQVRKNLIISLRRVTQTIHNNIKKKINKFYSKQIMSSAKGGGLSGALCYNGWLAG